MKQQTVYVPVKVEDELPPFGVNVFVTQIPKTPSMDGLQKAVNGRINLDGSSFEKFDKRRTYYIRNENNDFRDTGKPTHWLKEVQNVNILTDAELLELKKKWMQEAWDAADPIKKMIDDFLFKGESEIIHTDRETFSNSIKLD